MRLIQCYLRKGQAIFICTNLTFIEIFKLTKIVLGIFGNYCSIILLNAQTRSDRRTLKPWVQQNSPIGYSTAHSCAPVILNST